MSKLTLVRDEEIISSAEAVSLQAANGAGVEIRELDDMDDLNAVCRLLRDVWGTTDQEGPPIKAELLRAFSHAGNYVAGAFDESGLRGALVGFMGEGVDGIHLHSHILGVLPSSRARGSGFALKLHQRSWALRRGYQTVEWTFDPLVRRNAFFNLTKLAGDLHRYCVNFYGPMADSQNGGDDSDRVLLRWNLRAERVISAAAGVPHEPQPPADATRHLGLVVGVDGEPVRRPGEGFAATVVLQLPEDIIELRRRRTDLAALWRTALRHALTDALEDGYRCQGVTRSGAYVLTREPS